MIARSDPRSLHLPNTGNLRQPRLAKLKNLVTRPMKPKAIKPQGISLASLMKGVKYK